MLLFAAEKAMLVPMIKRTFVFISSGMATWMAIPKKCPQLLISSWNVCGSCLNSFHVPLSLTSASSLLYTHTSTPASMGPSWATVRRNARIWGNNTKHTIQHGQKPLEVQGQRVVTANLEGHFPACFKCLPQMIRIVEVLVDELIFWTMCVGGGRHPKHAEKWPSTTGVAQPCTRMLFRVLKRSLNLRWHSTTIHKMVLKCLLIRICIENICA